MGRGCAGYGAPHDERRRGVGAPCGRAVVRFAAVLLVVLAGTAHASPLSPFGGVRGFSFVSDVEGWACGDPGVLLHTSDGGLTWDPQEPGSGDAFGAIQMLADGRRGWVLGMSGSMIQTIDGGAHWTKLTQHSEHLVSLQILADGRRGWASGYAGAILHTRDGGLTW